MLYPKTYFLDDISDRSLLIDLTICFMMAKRWFEQMLMQTGSTLGFLKTEFDENCREKAK